ncbi:MAG: ester cyclase [Nocardioidaceae bacterium]
MSREQNIATQERFGEEVVAGGNFDAVDELVAPDFVDHDPAPGQAPGPDGLKGFFATMRAGLPDLSVSVEQLVADDEYVTIAYRITGTHQGDLLGVPATGRSVDVRGVQIGKFRDSLLVERWGSSDQLGMLQQIGAWAG